MALLGNIHLFVEEEELDSPVETSEHPVETGVCLTDHVRAKATELRLSGEIVGPDCQQVVEYLQASQRAGEALSYVGRHILRSVQIVGFTFSYTHRIAGGCRFTMNLRQVRVAQNIYTIGLGYSGNMEVRFCNGRGVDQVINLSARRERYHLLGPGEDVGLLVRQYRCFGVTANALVQMNEGRDVFQPGAQGDFRRLAPGKKMLLGVW